MTYFDSMGAEGAVEDIQRLRHVYTTQYHPFLDRCDAAVYPSKENRGGTPQERLSPGFAFSKREKAEWKETQYVSHDIEQMLNSFQNRMMRSSLKIDVAAMPKDKAEGVQQGIVEDYCGGILQLVNNAEADAVTAQSHMARMAMWAGRYGKICQFVDVVKGDGGWQFIWDFYHPRCVYHDFGSFPRVFVYEAYFSRPQVEHKLRTAYGEGGYRMPSKATEKKSSELVLLSELWVEERVGKKTVISNQCFVEDQAATSPTEKDYAHRPFHVIAMTGQGAAFQAVTESPNGRGDANVPFQTLEDHARPFYASLIDNVAIHDDFRSLELAAMRLAVNPPIEVIEESSGAAAGLENEPISSGTKVIHNREVVIKQMDLLSKQLSNFTTPNDLKEEKLHVWPSILWGAVASANESNILYTSRIDEGENAIVGPALLVATAYQRGFETILHMSREKGVEISMSATASKGKTQGKEYMLDFKAKRDIPEAFGLRITVPPMLPRDSLKTVQTYQLAVTSGMYDEELAMRDIGKLADPQAVIERRAKDRVRNSPIGQQRDIVKQLRDEVEALEQEAAREKDPKRKDILEQLAMSARMDMTQLLRSLMGQGQPSQMAPQPGTPGPEVQPPEERGMESPPLQRAMMGIPNPGGRPAAMPQGVA